jgi:hypothetical protein
LASGFQAASVPSVPIAANRLRVVVPPRVVKLPPAYTMPPLAAKAWTVLLALGFQDQ